jgi:hypothetical protein
VRQRAAAQPELRCQFADPERFVGVRVDVLLNLMQYEIVMERVLGGNPRAVGR